MEDSEFIVVDDEHREISALNNLKETAQAFGNARDSLLKGVALLNDTLNLTMELALKNTPPDFETDTEELKKRVLSSLDVSPEAVLRHHVKSLCSKLVAVQSQYEELANRFEAMKAEMATSLPPQVARLAGILDEIDACLPNSGSESASGTSANPDLDEICTRAEGIRDRVKVVMEKSAAEAARSNSVSCEPKDLSQTSVESSTSRVASDMDISRMIREEVCSALRSEVSEMMEKQKDFFQQALNSNSQSATSAMTTESEQEQQQQQHQREARQRTPMEAETTTTPNSSPSMHTQRRQKPSFLPDDERPLCPNCQTWCTDRHALEEHLETCLQYE